jgi:hypothetical protein
MIDSISTTDFFNLNLRERFFLERELEILPYYLRKNNTNKSQKILEDLFINKVLSDPYFSIYVCKKIEDSDFDLKDVFAYLSYVLLENYLSKSPLLNNIEIKERTLNLEQALDKRNFDYFSLKSSTYYHDKRDFKKAIDALPFRGEGINNRWSKGSLLNWDAVMEVPYYSLRSEAKVEYHMSEATHALESFGDLADFRDDHRFIFENIESNFRYDRQTDYMSINAPLFSFLNFSTDFISSVKNILEKYGYHRDFNNDEIGKYFKIYTDSILIGQFYWFVSLNQNQMLSLLNAYYDEQGLSFKKENLNIFPNSKLVHYFVYSNLRCICDIKDYNEAINLLNKLSESTDDMFLKHLCFLWTGEIYQERNDFDFAASAFNKAYELARDNDLARDDELRFLYQIESGKKSRVAEEQNKKYVNLLEAAEMYHHAGNANKSNELIQQLNSELQSLSILKQMDVWYDIYRDIYSRQEKVSEAILNKIIELAGIFNDSNSDYLEEDMEIIDCSVWDKNVSRMDCIVKHINHLKTIAEENKKNLDSKDLDLTADLFVMNRFYSGKYQFNEKTITGQLLSSMGLIRDVIHIDDTIPLLFAPNKRLEKIETVICEIESMDKDENVNIANLYTGSISDVIQRLKLKQARCYYLLNRNDSAQDILKDILDTATEVGVQYHAHCVLGTIFAKKQMVEDSIEHFKLAIDSKYLSEPGSGMVIEYCRDELLQSVPKEIFFETVDSIIDHINMKSKDRSYKDNGFWQAVDLCNQFGLTEESLHFIERGLLEKDEFVKSKLLEEKAYIKYLDGNLDASQELLDVAKQEIKSVLVMKNTEYRELCSSIFHKSSIIAGKRLDFKKAEKDMEMAIKILENSAGKPESSKLKSYSRLKDVYRNLSKNVIEYNKITDPDVVTILKTGEMIVSDLLNGARNRKIDYSLALAEYGKGLETALDNVITAALREHIFSLHTQKPIEDSYFKGEGKFKNEGISYVSPYGLKDALNCNEHKTISLGSWKGFIQDEILKSKSYKNPYLKDSYEFLRGSKSKEEWNVIAENCAVVKEYRNGSSHYGTKKIDYIFEKRADTIRKINEIIDILYP